ncbi:MAG: sulfite exporter TauE/SafE family protein [Thermoproteota archaeon]|nr:sulfite exporter TauE/SafE family protein [Thermoproteota archaeon]
MLESATMLIFLLGVGLAAGTIGSMLGVGGGIIMVPALTLLNLPPTQVASTSLIAVLSTSLSSTIEYSRQKRINYSLGLEMAACAIPGGILGAVLSEFLEEGSFKLYFGILLVLTGIYILYKKSVLKDQLAKSRSMPLQLVAVLIASFGAGIISSLFGVGGGIVFVPAMLLVLGVAMNKAAPTSQLTLMMTAVAGVFTHSFLGHPDYLQAVILSAGAFVGAQIGARLSLVTKDTILRRSLAIILMAVAVAFISEGLSFTY